MTGQPNPASVRLSERIATFNADARPSGLAGWLFVALVLLNVALGVVTANVPAAIGWAVVLMVLIDRNLWRTDANRWREISRGWRELAENYHVGLGPGGVHRG